MPSSSRRRTVAGVLTLTLAAAALAPAAAAAVHRAPQRAWSATSTPIPEGPAGEEVESDRRLGGELAIARDGTTWFAWAQDAMAATLPSTQRVLITSRPAGGDWAAPTVVGTVTRTTSGFPTTNDVELDLDGAGRPTVAWNENTGTVAAPTTQTELVHVRALGADGTWGAVTDFGVPMTLTPQESPISLEVARNGAAALAWQGTAGTYLARRADGTWGTAEAVETAAVAKVPDTVGLGFDQEGRATLVWRSWDATASAWDVRTRLHNGSGWAGDAVTLQEDATVAARGSVVVDGSGAAVANWGTNDGARAAVRTTATGAFAAPVVLSSGTLNTVADPGTSVAYRQTAGTGVPSAAFDAYGTATVVWPELDPTPRLAYAEVAPGGTWTPSATLAVDGTTTNPPVAPKVVVGRDGEAAAVWSRKVAVGASITGGQVVVSERPAGPVGTTSWSAPQEYTTPSNGAYGTLSALGLNNGANVGITGDATGDVTVAWTPYGAFAAAGLQQNRALDRPGARTSSLEWTARGIGGSTNVRSWLSYLRTDWASAGAACPQGLHEIQVSDGATMPGAGDDTSWRFTQALASKDASGRTIVQYDGELRWVMEAHCIDIRLQDPRLEIAADGMSARVYASGYTNGSMSDAMAGNLTTSPFANLRVLDVDLAGAGPRVSGDTGTWLSAPVTLASAAASTLGLDLYADQPFGFLTVTAPTTLGLAPAMTATGPETATYGAPATVTVSVPSATGTVTLAGAGEPLTASLVGGVAAFTLPATLAVGPHLLTASYAGDGTYAPRRASYGLTVKKATPVVSVVVPDDAVEGTASAVAVEVPGATGDVTLTGAGDPVTGPLVDGVATLALPVLDPGGYPLTATYPGDANHEAGSGAATLVVAALPAVSTTTVTLDRTSTRYGTPATATVTVAAAEASPSGDVSVVAGGRTLTGTLVDGVATVALPAGLAPGQQVVTASYAGQDGVTASEGSATLTVARAVSKVTLALAKSTIKPSQRATVTVRVTLPGTTTVTPKTTIVVRKGGTTLVSRAMVVGRTLTFKLPRLTKGSYRIKVVATATALLAGSTSAVKVLRVRP